MDMVDETITVTTASKVDQNDPHYVFAADLSDIQKAAWWMFTITDSKSQHISFLSQF